MTFLSTNSSREGLLEDVTLNLNLRCNFLRKKSFDIWKKSKTKKYVDFKVSGFQPRRYLDLRTEVLNLSLCLGLICNNKESAGRNLDNFFDAINLAITNQLVIVFKYVMKASIVTVCKWVSRVRDPCFWRRLQYSKSLLHVKWKIPLNKSKTSGPPIEFGLKTTVWLSCYLRKLHLMFLQQRKCKKLKNFWKICFFLGMRESFLANIV